MHLLLGVLAIVAGFAVLKGQMWARVVGIVMACLSMIADFLFVPHYPLVATDHRAGRGHHLGPGDVPPTGSLRASRACPAGELFGGQVDPAGCWSLRAGVQRPEGITITPPG